MGILSRLIGKREPKPEPQVEQVQYDGFNIKPAPQKQKGTFVTAGYIYMTDEAGETREHFFIRADTHADFDSACQHAIFKAKQIINESGERIFDKS